MAKHYRFSRGNAGCVLDNEVFLYSGLRVEWILAVLLSRIGVTYPLATGVFQVQDSSQRACYLSLHKLHYSGIMVK